MSSKAVECKVPSEASFEIALDDENVGVEIADEITELSGEPGIEVEGSFCEEEFTDEEKLGYKIIKRAAALRGVSIDRGKFLRAELRKHCSEEVAIAAAETTPQQAGVSAAVIDRVAKDAIRFESAKVTGLSALAGIPGGFAMAGTIPADLVQYFAHVMRIEQKLAYIYGWESFLNDEDEVDDETVLKLILFLGVMMEVGGASLALTKFASEVAAASVAKRVAAMTLTKTAWYPILKKVLRFVGIQITKKTVGKAAGKMVPVIGGLVSGALTFATYKPGAKVLAKHLANLPQAKTYR